MIEQKGVFTFESFHFDVASQTAHFLYVLDGIGVLSAPIQFEETLRFETPVPLQETAQLKQILFDLHIALGMSYWKTYCPPQIIVKSGELSDTDAAFWNTVYTKGLGEFFYENQIDFRGLIQFPVSTAAIAAELPKTPSVLPESAGPAQSNESLVALGGGKDSLTTVGLLRDAHILFDTVSLGEYALVENQAAQLGTKHFRVHRTIDPQLFALNEKGALNGHVPISVIYALTALCFAVAGNYRYVILSNEQSANEGNVEYLGEIMNHQWSKSFEFELMLRRHLEAHGIAVEYFSLLRPFTEFHITHIFSKYFDQWAGHFSSCNLNFTHWKKREDLAKAEADGGVSNEPAYWCGECPKCVFVFTMLAAWIPKERLVSALGVNPWANPKNSTQLRELLGVDAFKPFECVGTKEEMIAAAERMRSSKEYAVDALMIEYEALRAQCNLEESSTIAEHISQEHAIPPVFETLLDGMIR